MRLAVFMLVLMISLPALAQEYSQPQPSSQGTPNAPVGTAATGMMATPPAPSGSTAAAPSGPAPIITNLWRGDAALDIAGDLIKQQKYADALKILDEIIQRNMRNADAHVYSAICWANLGNFEKAKNSLSNAFAIDKGHMGAYLVGGVIALQQQDKTQAGYYLSAIRTVCLSDQCPEFQVLQKAINEAK